MNIFPAVYAFFLVFRNPSLEIGVAIFSLPPDLKLTKSEQKGAQDHENKKNSLPSSVIDEGSSDASKKHFAASIKQWRNMMQYPNNRQNGIFVS